MKNKKRTLKIYVHHDHYQEVDSEGRVLNDSTTRKKASGFSGSIVSFFYYIGLAVIYFLGSPFFATRAIIRGLYRDAVRTAVDIKNKLRNLPILSSWRPSMVVFFVLLLGGWAVFHSFLVVAEGQKLKGRVLGEADQGILNLKAAGASLGEQDSDLAQKHFQEALENFNQIQSDLNTNGVVLNGILKVLPQRHDADNLAESAQLATEAGSSMATVYEQLQGISFTPEGLHINSDAISGDVTTRLTTLLSSFDTATNKISLASKKLKAVDPAIVPEDKREIFSQVQSQLDSINSTITTTKDLIQLFSAIILGEKDILIVFQNNNELRPTGGFLGTFGALHLNNGAIQKLHISSIYDLDGQLTETINPPKPLYAVNNRWFMRDSNWFADFTTSAQSITNFYIKESGGQKADMVIGLTPVIVTDLLKITGPVYLPKYGVTLNDQNFVELTQVQTSINYDKTLNKPKQFLADFFPLFLQQLATLKGGQAISVLGIFQKNLQNKEIQLYAADPTLEAQINSFHWGGQILPTDRDYLSIVSANLGGTKTDLSMTQQASLTSQISDNGKIVNTVTLTRKNSLPRGNAGFTNRSFIRFLVPQGSTLISTAGFTTSPVPSIVPNTGFIDPAVKNWEANLVQNLNSGTFMGGENGKTFFGNWLEVAGGEERTVSISYALPFTVSDTDHLSLLFQKQSGALSFPLEYIVEHPGRNLSWGTRAADQNDNQTTRYTITADQDRFIGSIYTRN